MGEALIGRLEAAVSRLEALSAGAHPSISPRGLSDNASAQDPAILAFDDLVVSALGRVSAAAGKIGAEVAEVTRLLEKAFLVGKELLVRTKQTQKPTMESIATFMGPLNEVILEANALAEGTRSSHANHLKAAAGSLAALAWIGYTGKGCGMPLPMAHVEESWQMAEFYSNKVLVEYKNKDPDHVEWAKALKELYVLNLHDYIKRFYPLGPVWQPPGSATNKAPSAPSPPASLAISSASSSQPKSGMSAVFAEISSGKPVTQDLRKVTDDMKSKHRTDKTGVVTADVKETRNAPSFGSTKGPAKLELQMGRKWVVEHHIGNKSLIIEDCDTKQSVYAYGCKDCVLQVKGKVNNITIDKCTKVGVLFKGVVAACEIVNCNSVEVQCEGSVPTISIDNTSGCQLYLSEESLEASITTAKSSEINALVPDANSEGDWAEHSLPQQYIHAFKEGQFTTSPVSHSGA
ncbi:Cyclase-associated protein 1 [Dichanthelium oligosanthes]|uniref:Adenylyl cyclase-associated protein n=1 Tax=Dichanthelium oligosanthes TaxID=888268 RepID=A0A1E5UYQ8_9POAL|nr:Cyclase-associated protein 1 [Dichanthelium oligosanthes]